MGFSGYLESVVFDQLFQSIADPKVTVLVAHDEVACRFRYFA